MIEQLKGAGASQAQHNSNHGAPDAGRRSRSFIQKLCVFSFLGCTGDRAFKSQLFNKISNYNRKTYLNKQIHKLQLRNTEKQGTGNASERPHFHSSTAEFQDSERAECQVKNSKVEKWKWSVISQRIWTSRWTQLGSGEGRQQHRKSSATWMKKFQQGNGDFETETNRNVSGKRKKKKQLKISSIIETKQKNVKDKG